MISEPWIPLPEDIVKIVVEDLGSHLQQEMGAPQGPLHLSRST
jgi:hypothetical protein